MPTPPFRIAFQPIVDALRRRVISHEVLLRGPNGESPEVLLKQGGDHDRDVLDRRVRARALSLASSLKWRGELNLNISPRHLSQSDPIVEMLEVAARCGIPASRLVMELTEGEAIGDPLRFASAVSDYRAQGMMVAIDDFGAGFSGLNLLADFQPDIIKLDMNLVRGIASRGPRQAIVRAIISVCADLGIDVLAEGMETMDEYQWFRDEGVALFQGYLFARPGLDRPPDVVYPDEIARPQSFLA